MTQFKNMTQIEIVQEVANWISEQLKELKKENDSNSSLDFSKEENRVKVILIGSKLEVLSKLNMFLSTLSNKK